MLAAEIRSCGEPPVVAERGRPAGDVLVEVVAAPITPLDVLCATGTSYFGRPATPYVPGVQGVGLVDGRPVWFASSAGMAPGDGSMREVAAVRRHDVVELPDGLDLVLMAGLGLSAVAAHEALTRAGGLAAGETVVVLGAGGVVGQAAVQLGRACGAGRVVAAARSATGQERARSLGADAVLALDTDDGDELSARFADAVEGAADLVIDPLYGAPAAAAASCLRPGGRLVNLGGSAGEHSTIGSSLLRGRSLHVIGYTNNALTQEQRASAIGVVASYALERRLTVSHEAVPLADATDAWRRQAEGRAEDRIVLTTGS